MSTTIKKFKDHIYRLDINITFKELYIYGNYCIIDTFENNTNDIIIIFILTP
jgi:hypothetical protein